MVDETITPDIAVPEVLPLELGEEDEEEGSESPSAPPEIRAKNTDIFVDNIHPSSKGADSEWIAILEEKKRQDPAFTGKCISGELTEGDIATLAQSLEVSGDEGVTLDVFAAHLRLLEEEVAELARKHPVLGRAIKLARVRRKGLLKQQFLASAHRSPKAALEGLDANKLSDILEVEEKAESEKTIETLAEEHLYREGYRPVEPVQVLFLLGGEVGKRLEQPPVETSVSRENLAKDLRAKGWPNAKTNDELFRDIGKPSGDPARDRDSKPLGATEIREPPKFG